MTCPICRIQKNNTCTCGYCQDCIELYGHQGCAEILEDRKSKELKNEKKRSQDKT